MRLGWRSGHGTTKFICYELICTLNRFVANTVCGYFFWICISKKKKKEIRGKDLKDWLKKKKRKDKKVRFKTKFERLVT